MDTPANQEARRMSPSLSPDAGGRVPVRVLTVVLVYAIFASLWIFLSDHVVSMLFADSTEFMLASTLKGWLFVAVTALLLYWLLAQRAAGTPALPERNISARSLFMPMAVLGAVIVALTMLGIWHNIVRLKSAETARLEAIASIKVRQVADWLAEREADARFLRSSAFMAENFMRWRLHGDVAAGRRLQVRLVEFAALNSFAGCMLFDGAGETLWNSADGLAAPTSALRGVARKALGDRQIARVGPYRDAAGRLHIDFVVPQRATAAGPDFVIVLHADPSSRLFPLLLTWPVPSASGEALLVRRDGDEALFLNDLRYQADTAVKLRVPLSRTNVLAVQALRDTEKLDRVLDGEDYRGVPSLGVVRVVPGTDWYLVTKLDREEVFREALRDTLWISLAGLLALFVAAAGVFLFRQRQLLLVAQAAQTVQAEKLRALQLLDAIAACSSDAIFAKDTAGRYLLFNREAARVTGKSVEEVLGRDDTVLFPPEQAAHIMAHDQRVMAEGRTATFQENLTTADGEVVYLATKGPLRDADGRLIGIFGISRDITERGKAELALRESEKRFHDIVDASADWIWEVDGAGRFTYVSESVFDLLGYTPDEILGKTPFDLMPPEEAARVRLVFREITALGIPFRDLDNVNLHKDGSVRHILTNGMPILGADGRLAGYRGLDRDVSDKKRADEAQRRQNEELARRNDELERFNRATVGRELDMIELKRQINALSLELGREAPYALAAIDAAASGGKP